MRRAFTFRMFAALWGIVLGPLVPAGAGDLARSAPDDTFFYAQWSDFGGADAWVSRAARAVLDAPLVRKQLGADSPWPDTVLGLVDELFGHPGCLVVMLDPASSEKFAVAGVIDGGDGMPELTKLLASVFADEDADEPGTPITVAGEALREFALGNGPPVYYKALPDRLILASDGALAARIAKLAAGDGASLADSPELALGRRKAGSESGAAQIEMFCNFGPKLEALAGSTEGNVARLLDVLQLKSWRSGYSCIEQRDGVGSWFSFMHVRGEGGPLAALWQQRPLRDADLAVVPKNAYWASAGKLDLDALWQSAHEVIADVLPDAAPQVDGAIALSAQMLGFSITDDLLPAFGDTWVAYDAPDQGGFLFLGMVLVNDARDPQALHDMLMRTVEFLKPLAAQRDVALQVRQMKAGDDTIHYFLVGGLPVPIAPAWSISDGKIVFGFFPQTVKAALRQIDSETRGESLLDHPDFRAACESLPRELTGLVYADTHYYYRTIYGLLQLVQTALASISAQNERPIDLADFPSYPEESSKVRSFVAGTGYDADGIVSRGSGAPPLSAFFMNEGGVASIGTIALLVSIMLPSLSRARELAKRAVSASNLRGIGMGCQIWAADHKGDFPESLQQLIDVGILMPESLISPRDPDAFTSEELMRMKLQGRALADHSTSSYVYVAGQTTDSHPQNVLAYEKVMGDEGTSVLFVDSHVEWLKPEPLKRVMRATYERLGRLDELPAEFK